MAVAAVDRKTTVEPGTVAPASPQDLQLAGNAFYGQRQYSAAADKYTAAIDKLRAGGTSANTGPAWRACHMNRAACFLQMGMFARVVQDCTTLLDRDPTNVKALFRRAKALSTMRTDILSISNAMQDLRMAVVIAPHVPHIHALKEQVERDLPALEKRLLDLQFHDTPFWEIGNRVMVSHKAYKKLGGRGSLGLGEVGTVLDVDEDMQAGGRVKVQGKKSTYWYDMEELGGACGEQDSKVVNGGAQDTSSHADGNGTTHDAPATDGATFHGQQMGQQQQAAVGMTAKKFVDPSGNVHLFVPQNATTATNDAGAFSKNDSPNADDKLAVSKAGSDLEVECAQAESKQAQEIRQQNLGGKDEVASSLGSTSTAELEIDNILQELAMGIGMETPTTGNECNK